MLEAFVWAKLDAQDHDNGSHSWSFMTEQLLLWQLLLLLG